MKILQKSLISMIVAAGLVISTSALAYAGSKVYSYIIVHCYNPEGKEINSIEGMDDCATVAIYDGDEVIGYGSKDKETYNQPITMNPGVHKIKVSFNGMELLKEINLAQNQTQELTFVFPRREITNEELLTIAPQSCKAAKTFQMWQNWQVYVLQAESPPWARNASKMYALGPESDVIMESQGVQRADINSYSVEATIKTSVTQPPLGGVESYLYAMILSAGGSIDKPITIPVGNFDKWIVQNNSDRDTEVEILVMQSLVDYKDSYGLIPRPPNPLKGYYCSAVVPAKKQYNYVRIISLIPDMLYKDVCFDVYAPAVRSVSGSRSLFVPGENLKMSSVPYDLLGTAVGEARPVASIKMISPSPAKPGDAVTMQGEGSDSDGQIIAYSWRSSIDGQLSDQSSFNTAGLREGKHKIYFKVMDDVGVWSEEVSRSLYIGLSDSSSDKTHGESKDKENSEGEPVNIVSGNMYTIEEDISIPGKGLGFDYSRCYNSHKVYKGPIGYGWTHSYNVLFEEMEEDGQVRIMLEDGRAIYFKKEQNGSYSPPAGEDSSLSKAEDEYIWRQKDGIKYYFGLAGKLKKITCRNNNQISLSYETDGLLSRVSDSAGRQINFAYNSENQISEVNDPAGNKVKYSYDTNGNLIRVTDIRGKDTIYEYNSEHNIIKITDAKGSQLYFEYDSQDRCIANYRDNDLLRVNLSYDPVNRKTTISDSLGRQRVKTYNQDGLVTQVEEADGKSIYYTWDAQQNRTSIKDRNGNLTQMSYDGQGNLLSITDAQNNTTSYEYEPNYNFITKTTDSQGKSTIYNYDSNGNQTSVTNALGYTTNYTYDNSGQIIRVEDARGNSTSYEYDNYGNLTLSRDALGNQTRSNYDITGNRTSITDAQGNTTNYEYDQAGNVTAITYPDTTQLKITYDETGNRGSITDANGNTSRFEYTPTDKLAKSEDGLGRQVTYTYDSEENLTQVSDAKGNITKYSYDKLNRLVKEETPIGIITRYEYDAAGNKIAVTDGKGQVIRYEYDSLNRMIKKIYPDGKNITYNYDSLSRVTEISEVRGGKGEGRINYQYDTLNRLIRIESLQSGKTSTLNK